MNPPAKKNIDPVVNLIFLGSPIPYEASQYPVRLKLLPLLYTIARLDVPRRYRRILLTAAIGTDVGFAM